MKKLNNFKWFTLGVAVCLILSMMVFPAMAASFSKTAELVYNNIKITLNGNAITPKDASGNTVEPFIIDGTTYLPVRAVGNALGVDVGWNGATSTVQLTGSSSGDSSWKKYNDAYPFLFLHSAADNLQSIYGVISDYRNAVYLTYGRVAKGQMSVADYATYSSRVSRAIDTITSEIAVQMNYIDSLEGTYNNTEFKALQKKAKLGYENLLYSLFSLESMAQAVEDCWAGKSGTATIIDAGDSSVGDYLTIALGNIEIARDESLEYLVDALPSSN